MVTPVERDLSSDMVAEPLNAYRVAENQFAVTTYPAQLPYMVTYGISVCKGIVIYSPEEQRGLVGHLAMAPDRKKSLGKIAAGFDSTLAGTDILLIESMQSSGDAWPSLESLQDYFMSHNPRTLTIDTNHSGIHPRGISLDLRSGQIREIDGSNGWTWSEDQDTSLNQRIHSV